MPKAKVAASKIQIQSLLEELEKSQKIHIDIGFDMQKVGGGELYMEDFFSLAMIQKSKSIIRGFCKELRDNNFLCALPLVRLHLDTLLNTYALFIVNDPVDFALKKFKGKQTNRLKDREGNAMSDSYLARKLSESKELDASWALNLYIETSKFIHMSDKHLFSIFEKVNERGEVDIEVGETKAFPDSVKIEALMAMKSITFCLFRLWNGWVYTKKNRDPLKRNSTK